MTKTGVAARPPLENSAESLIDWFKAHGKQVGLAAIGIAVVVAGVVFWRGASTRKELNADRALADAQRTYASGNLPLAQSDLQRLAQRYGGTRAAVQGQLLLAQVHFENKKVDDGLRVLGQISSPGIFAASVHAMRGIGLEQAGKPAEAAEAYLAAARAADTPQDKALHQADAARAYAAAGRKDDAIRVWRELANDEQSPLSGEAKLRLGELEATTAKS
jgi:predicted negative regulator of RcsB-dependent stress response